MKKVIGIVLIAVLGLSLAACGGSDTDENMVLANGEYVSESEAAAFEESNAEAADGVSGASEEIEESEESEESLDTSMMIDETVLWDENDFTITATSLSFTEWYVLLELKLENNSDQTLTFYNGTVNYDWSAVNGYMLDSSYINAEVAPGKTDNTSFQFVITSLNLLGISDIADLRFGMAVEYEDGNVVELPATQIKTSAYDSHDDSTDTYQEVVDSGSLGGEVNYKVAASSFDTVYSENGISIISEVLAYPQDEKSSDAYPVLFLEMDNQSEDNIYIQISDIAINDVMISEDVWDTYSMFSESKRVQLIDFDTVFWIENVDDELLDEVDLDDGVDRVTVTLSVEDENGEEISSAETVTIDFT